MKKAYWMQRMVMVAVVACLSLFTMQGQTLNISLSRAGTLGERIADSEKLSITDLTLSGELNGSDMLFLREMAGRSFTGTKTHGQLQRLDLSDTRIVSGGSSYMRYYAGDSPVEPRTVEDEFPQWVFSACDSLETVVLPQGINAIGEYAFRGCNLLQRVSVPATVTTIGSGAFMGCFHLSDVQIPATLTQLGSYAFKNCQQIVALHLPDALQRIGTETFYGCTGMTDINLPQALQAIGDRAFYGCRSLEQVQLPVFLLQIGDAAFYDCDRLTSLTLPMTLSVIGAAAFSGCDRLTEISVAAGNKNFVGLDGVLFNTAQDVLLCYPAGRMDLAYLVPDGVVQVASAAFAGSSALREVSIPSTVRSIGNTAFLGTGLHEIVLPEGVETLGIGAFMFCPALQRASLPSTVQEIDPETFAGSAIADINVSAANPFYTTSNGVLYNKEQTTLVAYPSGRPGPCVIPDGVERIGAYAFEYAEQLGSVYMPATLKSIGEQAFYLSYMDTICCRAEVPPYVYDYGLDDVECTNMLLYVPEGSLFDYLDADGWSNWYIFNYEELTADEMDDLWLRAQTADIGTVEHSSWAADLSFYDLQGRRIADGASAMGNRQWKKGFMIVRAGKNCKKLIVK